MNQNILYKLQEWYDQQCDGDWEHQYGIQIGTIDNPGWAIFIDLTDTKLEKLNFSAKEIENSEKDWIHCRVENKQFVGFCGPFNLAELLDLFFDWVDSASEQGSR